MKENKSRLGKIGASEIAGLVKEYAGNFLERHMIGQELYDKLQEMPLYLQTRYSMAKKLQFTQDQLEKYHDFIDNPNMRRGRILEEQVMQQVMNEFGFEVLSSQDRFEQKSIDPLTYPLIATLDYIVSDNNKKLIVECKTTDINLFDRVKKNGIPFAYVLQVQQQMYLSGIDQAMIYIAAVNTISNKKGREEYQILDGYYEKVNLDQKLIELILISASWLNYEIEHRPEQIFSKSEKMKADIEVDAFLAKYEDTKQIALDDQDFETMLQKYIELKPITNLFKQLDLEIKSKLEEFAEGHGLDLSCGNMKIIAKYTTPSFHSFTTIQEEIEKQEKRLEEIRSLQEGDLKSKPYLKWEVGQITNLTNN
jgi:predicted phage-related endonuclease